MYTGSRTIVRSAAGDSGSFGVKVGVYQGLALVPFSLYHYDELSHSGSSETAAMTNDVC